MSSTPKLASETCCESTIPWYLDKKFQRYWSHWNLVCNWYEKHTELLRREKNEQWQAFYAQWWQSLYQKHCIQQMAATNNENNIRDHNASMPPPRIPEDRKNKSRSHSSCQKYVEKSAHSQDHFHKDKGLSRGGHKSQSHVYDCSSKRKSQGHGTCSSDSSISGMSRSGSKVHSKKKKRSKKKRKNVAEEEQYEMEITQEMMEFFEKSALHRKERDEKRNKENQSDDYQNLSELNFAKSKGSILPPSERPGAKRTMEMKYLYGKDAALIHGMETAIQMNFDRNCDLTGAKPWPHLPLKIQFS